MMGAQQQQLHRISTWLRLLCWLMAAIVWSSEGLSPAKEIHRRAVFEKAAGAVLAIATFSPEASLAVPLTPASRDVEVGSGYDLLAVKRGAADGDAVYPPSMVGRWICEKTVNSIAGDKFQAGEMYRCLGSRQPLKEGSTELFETKYIETAAATTSTTEIPGLVVALVVVDRRFEISSRAKKEDVLWNAEQPNVLEFSSNNINNSKVKLVVVKRSVEVPSDNGFGFDELMRVEDGAITRAVQIKRRYRRSYDEQGNRVVEGLEIMKTYRVLDGIAGIEFPTSTVKSQIRLVRPPPTPSSQSPPPPPIAAVEKTEDTISTER